ncbi:MAG: hypothetical protein GEU93_15680 [Propionibacteriales bacterium]|nr:hypothetical protein [Propionibacteriales bacterium]
MRIGNRGGSCRRLVPVGLALGLLAAAGACDAADSGGSDSGGSDGGSDGSSEPVSLEGETIDFVVPYDPGGGYDVYARLAAPYIEECSGATVAVKNEPGAGGLLATSKTFVSPPDELRIQIMNTIGIIGAQMAEAEGVQFQVDEFSWLGRVSTEPNILVVSSDSEITSFQDILDSEEPVTFAATGPGSNEYINSTVLPKVYDVPFRIVTGFDGGDDARAAVLAGDLDAHIQPLDSQISMIESGDLRPILLISKEQNELVPDTPTLADFEPPTSDGPAILDALLVLTETGRGVAASPNIDEGQRAALQEAVNCALQDEEFVAEAESQQRSIMALPGEEMAAMIDEVMGLQDFRDLVREAS